MTITKAAVFSFSLGAQEPMAYLRLYAPLREAGIELIDGFQNRLVNENAVFEADIVIFQREFPFRFEDYKNILTLARNQNKPVVFELDDLLFMLPDTHPDRRGAYFAPSVLPMVQAIKEADLITVTTDKLAQVVSEINPRVQVLPNYLDDHLWEFNPPQPKTNEDGKVTIGYMGTNSHQPDLAYIAPVLEEMVERYPDKVQIHFWGARPPETLVNRSQVKWTSEYYSSYQEFAAFFQTQSADIFIAPLVDNLFNRCKSSIKFFEYSALGAACVCSHLEPYQDIVKHQHNGFLAKDLDEWRFCLTELIENDDIRYQFAINAQEGIQQNWMLSKNAGRWSRAYRQAKPSIDPKDKDQFIFFLDTINQQLFEYYSHKEEVEKELRTQLLQREHENRVAEFQLAQSKAEVDQLNKEVLDYVLSKSWRWTRPFRKINKKIKEILGASDV